MKGKIKTFLAIFIATILSCTLTQAQVTIGADKLPETFSVLQLEGKYSNDKHGGLRLPQLTTAERDAMNIESLNGTDADKASGLMIYNTDTNCIEFWNNLRMEWISLCEGGGGSDGTSKPGIIVEGGCGLGITFRIHPAYPRDEVEAFNWQVAKISTTPSVSVAGAIADGESLYIPYDETQTGDVNYFVQLDVELKNGMSFEVTKTGVGRYNGDFDFKMVGAKCYDTKQTDYGQAPFSTAKYGDWSTREQVVFGQEYAYEVVTIKANGGGIYQYEWSVDAPSDCLSQIQLSDATKASAKLSFQSSLGDDPYLKANPTNEYLITLTCKVKVVQSGSCQPSFTLRKVIKIGDRDCCTSLADVDGNTYHVGMFGDAGCWMTQNLRVIKYADGTPITYNNDIGSDMTSKYYAYPNNNVNILNTHPEYGLLYTKGAASN